MYACIYVRISFFLSSIEFVTNECVQTRCLQVIAPVSIITEELTPGILTVWTLSNIVSNYEQDFIVFIIWRWFWHKWISTKRKDSYIVLKRSLAPAKRCRVPFLHYHQKPDKGITWKAIGEPYSEDRLYFPPNDFIWNARSKRSTMDMFWWFWRK